MEINGWDGWECQLNILLKGQAAHTQQEALALSWWEQEGAPSTKIDQAQFSHDFHNCT